MTSRSRRTEIERLRQDGRQAFHDGKSQFPPGWLGELSRLHWCDGYREAMLEAQNAEQAGKRESREQLLESLLQECNEADDVLRLRALVRKLIPLCLNEVDEDER